VYCFAELFLFLLRTKLDRYRETTADNWVEGKVEIISLEERRVFCWPFIFRVFHKFVLKPYILGVNEGTMCAIWLTWIFKLWHMNFQVRLTNNQIILGSHHKITYNIWFWAMLLYFVTRIDSLIIWNLYFEWAFSILDRDSAAHCAVLNNIEGGYWPLGGIWARLENH